MPSIPSGSQPRQPSSTPRKPRTARQPVVEIAPESGSLEVVRAAAEGCTACPLWAPATQTVFGEGSETARVMLVGEQPGDQEDRQGHPFVGPAGQLLDSALREAGVDRDAVYVTNAVKHFKFEMRGTRRLHKKPADGEIAACHQWLDRELKIVHPELVVAMGASAARSLLGKATSVEANRGRFMPFGEQGRLVITVHPSYLLRIPDEYKQEAFERFVQDLRMAGDFLRGAMPH
ncbi:UdgX family uracil-DNA binding protein [Noviherbaspirillum galbum]|uniref:Type-4 uracil-DNA glycosylase n=1 Tax=Noviherbaspirillum galbum TaxID=2709383 RepID=A0A6B3SP76_9BURK|nr:UdgX family uracil-DNA binding protein [Noviherbaspirillum galbum]NEX60516.1 UdgX family uracil-DNA binding protein [Noviherbaspirillum galbum]